MILDTLSQCRRYAGLHPGFGKAFDFLETAGASAAVGRVAIDGEAIHAIVQDYRTRDAVGALLEAHRRHIDIQYVVRGREAIHWATLGILGPAAVPYDPDKDAALFAATAGVV
ncbi:MAG: YhcH/YjgK/YiaL family protein, partial [Planctomycetia bacterium]